jgi:uncharacterized protein (DUF4213/DUF364 family)
MGRHVSGIASEFLHLVDRVAAAIALPAVAAIHLPPATATGHSAEFSALELADGSIGLAYLWLGYGRARLQELLAELPLPGDAAAIARGYGDADPARRAIGFAALNAVSQHLFSRAAFAPDTAKSSIALLDPQPGDHVGMVGLFPPLVPRILATGARLTVVELDPARVQEAGRFRVTLDRAALSACDKVVSTSTVLLNDTIDEVLAACRAARYVGLIGPGAGCLPDPLFARGVSTLGGTRVVARDAFLASLAEAKRWTGAEKYTIRREEYVGVDALLSRAGPAGLAPAR